MQSTTSDRAAQVDGVSRSVVRSTIRWRPTLVGYTVLFGGAWLLFFSRIQFISYGFLIVIGLAMVVDAVVSKMRLTKREFEIHCTRDVVMSPDTPTFSVSASPGDIGVNIGMVKFSVLDTANAEIVFMPADDAGPFEVAANDGPTPSVQSVVRFEVYASVLGLVRARQILVHTPAQIVHRAPEFIELETTTTAVAAVDEVARLRDYVPGDRRGRIAWTTTARTGQLHVRDAGNDDEGEVCVVVELGGNWDVESPPVDLLDTIEEFTRIAATAGSLVRDLLEQGLTVNLRNCQVVSEYHLANAENARNEPWKIQAVDASYLRVVDVEGLVSNETALLKRLAGAEPGDVHRPAGPYLEICPKGYRWVS